MSKKKWHENIPAGGVLCKENSSGSIVRIIGKSNLDDSMVIDDCVSSHHFYHDELTPLTAAEWWEFAPWKDMDSAPRDEPMLIIANGVVQQGVFAVSDDGEIYGWETIGVNIEQQVKEAIEEFGELAYERFLLQVSEYGKLKNISSVNFKSNNELIDSVGKFAMFLKQLPELFEHDVKFYGNDAYLMWEWQYKDRAHLNEWFKCDKQVRLSNPLVNYRRLETTGVKND